MIKLKLLLVMLMLLPNFMNSQEFANYSKVKTKTGEVKIPGSWSELNTMNDSGQTYLKNADGIIIAIAQNPKKAYPFFESNKSDFENVTAFYTWDSDYRKENQFKVQKIKENPESEYIIWKYREDDFDNVFLFGSSKTNFLNLLVYTNSWTENEKITFLEKLYKLNK